MLLEYWNKFLVSLQHGGTYISWFSSLIFDMYVKAYCFNSDPSVVLLCCMTDVRSLDEDAGMTALADPVLSWR
jgi:hypothetical protein